MMYKYPLENQESMLYKIACMYLVFKTLNIAATYPSFSAFESVGNVDAYGKLATQDEEGLLKKLVSEINKKKSHITVKVRQVLHFLTHIRKFSDTR